MTDRRQEIRARLDAATQTGNEVVTNRPCVVIAQTSPVRVATYTRPSLDLIAHAPADIAWLLAEVERLRTENGTELLRDEPVAQGVTERNAA